MHDAWLHRRLQLFSFDAEVRTLLRGLRRNPFLKLALITSGDPTIQRLKIDACGAATIFE